jgi:multidrug efflux pump subunit AcrA (membrane-fusion protein)
MTKRRWALFALIPIFVISVAALRAGARTDIETAAARRDHWTDWLEVRGEVKALRSLTLTASPRAGSELQLLKIVASGTAVKAGDVVAEFDGVRRQRQLDEQRAALRQAEAEVAKTRAEARLKDEENRTKLVKADYDVERAKLEAAKSEVVAPIEGEKKNLDLADKESGRGSLKKQVNAERTSWSAQIAGASQKQRTAELDVKESENVIEAMVVRAPVDGTVTILPNNRARTGGWNTSAPDFKVGDRAWPGAPIAELPDLSSVRITARVDESDRGRLAVGQEARVRIDAIPDKDFPARVAEISPLAKMDFSAGWPWPKNFDVTFELKDAPDARMRSGMGGLTRVAVDRSANVVIIPAKACFNKDGRTVVYVRRLWRFEERPVEIARRSKTEVVVTRGVSAGDNVALADPTSDEGQP